MLLFINCQLIKRDKFYTVDYCPGVCTLVHCLYTTIIVYCMMSCNGIRRITVDVRIEYGLAPGHLDYGHCVGLLRGECYPLQKSNVSSTHAAHISSMRATHIVHISGIC